MSREQIKKMAKVLCEDCAKDTSPCWIAKAAGMCDAVLEQAEALYNAGYRKASDVAEEIFAEIAKSVALKIPPHIRLIFKNDVVFQDGLREGKTDALREVLFIVAELRKKYTEGENNEREAD